MKIKFSREQAEQIIKTYYQDYESKSVQISTKVINGCEGIHEIPYTHVAFTVSSTIPLFGESVQMDEELTEKQVEEIFTTMLSEKGYSVDYISYDAGTTTGDFYDRGTRTYFNGINVSVAKKEQKVKTIGSY